jgi:CHAT domain-containing protein
VVREHLTGPELEGLLFPEASVAGVSGNEEALEHCTHCSQCATLVNAHRKASREIGSLKRLPPNSARSSCPPEEQWLNLAAGLTDDDLTMRLLEHASQCSACAQQLKHAQGYLAGPPADSLDLKSATPEWQRRMAERIAENPAQSIQAAPRLMRPTRRWWIYAPLVASAAAALLVLTFHSWLFRPNVEQLLADAYSQRRTLETRIPGAAYAPWRQERASDQESVVSTQNVIEKPAAAVRGLCQKVPKSDDCLIYSAQVDVLARRYKPALAALAQIKEKADSRKFLLVRAQAEFEKGEMEGEARSYTSSYGQAIEDLSRILSADPHDPIALFNRALAYERLQSFKAAAADWQELLKVEKDPGWITEAKRHLDSIREKESSRLQYFKALYDPERSYKELVNASRLDPIHSEAYFETAVEQWLPATPAVSRSVLDKLAAALRDNHHDVWLLDFLAAPAAPRALTLLRSAISANIRGDVVNAARQARLAEGLFQRDGNLAGAARSRFEFVYAQHRQFNASECSNEGLLLQQDLKRHSYTWLRIGVLLEIFGCQLMASNFDRAQVIVDEAIQDARAFQFPVLLLRAESFKTSSRRTEGQLNRFWSEIQTELAVFWTGGFYPPERAYHFYADLEFAAEEAGQWRLAEALQREALSLIRETGREDVQAYAHFRLGEAAEMAGDFPLAGEEFEAARRSFQQLPPTEATRRFQADAAIALALIETRQGEIQPAKRLLEEAQPQLAGLESFLPQLNFSLANADVARSEQQWQQERHYLEEAVRIGNDGFKAIHSQRERWSWRRQMEIMYRRLLQIKLRANPGAAQALAEWETFRAAEVRGGVPVSSFHPNGGVEELILQTGRLHDSTMIALAVLPDRIQSWVADDRGIEGFSTFVAEADVERKVQAFYQLCSGPAPDATGQKELAGELYRLLLGPLQARLDRQRILLIESDGPLANLPWSALLTPEGKYLGEMYSLASTPGLFYEEKSFARNAGERAGKTLIVIPGPVSFDGQSLAPLPQAEEEAQALAHLSPGMVCLRGNDANLRELKKTLPEAAVFHFAGHAVGFEHGGELVLAGADNTLTAAGLSGLRLSRCRLVVLSACSTAVVGQDILRNPDGLVQAFLNSGAERVIASRWNIDSGATAEFMRVFYESLQGGNGAAAALREARRRALSDARTAAPYYWASFDIFGAATLPWSSPIAGNLLRTETRRPVAKEEALVHRLK